jgi:hexulose-6-phosphate isomerase
MTEKNRREFLKSSAAAICAAGLSAATRGETNPAVTATSAAREPGSSAIKKGLVFSMLPEKLSVADRFKLARDTGFEVIQAPTAPDAKQADELKAAADASGVRVDSVMNMAHWKYPLSSADPAVVETSMEGMRTSLQNAKLWGCDAVLLVPAVVNPQTSYKDAWTRSQKQVRALLPLAEELKIVIAIEEVWNKFLLSPLEMLAYINEFKHPLVRAWFDVGNVVLYGYPQDWIHTLGATIAKVHLKDFKRTENGYAWVNLGEGDIDWPAVRQAFSDVGYQGSAIAELQAGDESYLRDVNKRIDRLLLGRS